jgi:hypothetical protein
VKELGMERELEALLEHAKQTVQDLYSLEVTSFEDFDEPGEPPRLVITACRDVVGTADDPTWSQWAEWFVRAYPSDVIRWFGFEVSYRKPHGR